ncbi:MAG: metal ABC transporter permease [Deltaproteobacteria bacterium]|nr:metal ABC transporter permease [Deltaproteobacteria bacterium]
MGFTLQVLLPAFLTCVVLTALLSYLGLHVLAREVFFVDIALAQVAALGTAVAACFGVEPRTHASYLWSLAFAITGAALLPATRGLRQRVPPEAFIGISYAVAAAATILVASFLSHGDEELKEILVGSLLTIELPELVQVALVFAALAAVHFILRKRFLAMSFDRDPAQDGFAAALWDFAFYGSLAVAVTSAVQTAGVLLVFSFLIVPPLFSALFCRRLGSRLVLSWLLGVTVSAVGLLVSFQLDLPTGATVVVALGAALFFASVVRLVLSSAPADRSGGA